MRRWYATGFWFAVCGIGVNLGTAAALLSFWHVVYAFIWMFSAMFMYVLWEEQP